MTALTRAGLSLLAVAAPAVAAGLFLAVVANALAEDAALKRATVEAEIDDYTDEQRSLTAEAAALRSPERLRGVAAELNLIRPSRDGDAATSDAEGGDGDDGSDADGGAT